MRWAQRIPVRIPEELPVKPSSEPPVGPNMRSGIERLNPKRCAGVLPRSLSRTSEILCDSVEQHIFQNALCGPLHPRVGYVILKSRKCAVIRTIVEEPCELAKNDRRARPASHVPRIFGGLCAYSLRTISDMSPVPTFRGPVVINPLVLSIVLITANDEISETKTPHTLSNPA